MSARAQRLYWVYLDEKVHGPYTVEQIARIPGVGERTRICPDGSEEWTTLADVAAQNSAREAAKERRCPKCEKRAPAHASFCPHCGASLEAGVAPASPARRRSLWPLLLLAAAAAGGSYAWWTWQRQRQAEEPTGRAAVSVSQFFRASSLRDVHGELHEPLSGQVFCVLTLAVRDPDPHPAMFQRADIQWSERGKGRASLDPLTSALPDELLSVSRLEPGAGIEGRVVVQAPAPADHLELYYGSQEVPISPSLLAADRRWRGQEERAIAALKRVRCGVGDEKPHPLDPDIEYKAKQELGPLYHVDAEDYSFHVDLSSGKISEAPDVDELVTENTRRDCFEHTR